MPWDYIVEGVPIFPACPSPAILLDKLNNNIYISNGTSTNWILIGTLGGQSDSIQNVTTSQTLTLLGSINTFVKATAGSGGIILTLPNAIGLSGQVITIIQVDTGVGGVLIEADQIIEPAQTINNSSSYALTNQYQTVSFESDNANWFVRSTAN